MSEINFFRFEDKKHDFPFYNEEYPLGSLGFKVLLLALILDIAIIFLNLPLHAGYIFLFVGAVAIGIASKGNFNSIIHKPRKSDFKLIVIVVIVQFFFILAISLIEISVFNMDIASNPAVTGELSSTWAVAFDMIFALMGEELFKLIAFFTALCFLYKKTHFRRISVILATLFAILIFGFLHGPTYGNYLHGVVAIGLGSIFMMYIYLKTKNVLLSYLAHLLYDYMALFLSLVLVPSFLDYLMLFI